MVTVAQGARTLPLILLSLRCLTICPQKACVEDQSPTLAWPTGEGDLEA